uniref:Reverse transcriptase domain-containing protein n=1 Tax=Oreochromis niloticus TaxID=8128 RepID=A0A669CPU2_ORENI
MVVLFDAVFSRTTVQTSAPVRRCRIINPSTAAQFATAFNQLSMPANRTPLDTENLSSWFQYSCLTILDSVAPLKTRKPKAKTDPWFNDVTRAVRRECRRAERRWKRDKLQVSLQILKDCWRLYQDTVKEAKRKYFSKIISSNSHNPRVLFKSIDSVLNAPQSGCLEASHKLSNDFMCFFIEKVATTRALISSPESDPSVSIPCSAVFNQFEPVTLSYLEDVVGHLRPSGSPNDPVPPQFFKEIFPSIGQAVLTVINSSLISGVVPANFKHAVVQPLLKKPALDHTVLASYRPISKLSFMSKILEKIVHCQLMDFLNENGILEVFQSGFKNFHSTESALLKVFNDILLSCDSGNHVVLVLLDLTAAFDTVDHNILLSRLHHLAGIRGTALKWFRSYLCDRTFSVNFLGYESSSATFQSGVPQGSILGPLLFSLYLQPLGTILRRHGISFHCYADDCQIYLPLKQKEAFSIKPLLACLEDIKSWMSLNFLRCNSSKTEVILFGPSGPCVPSAIDLGPLAEYVKSVVTNLGFKMDSDFKLGLLSSPVFII